MRSRALKRVWMVAVAVATALLVSASSFALTVTNGMEAGWVLGQTDFTTGFDGNSPTFGAVSPPTASTLNIPDSLAWDTANNRLFVLDSGNNRVLIYNGVAPGSGFDGRAANVVLGQQSFSGSAPDTNCSGTSGVVSACGLSNPGGMAYDAANNRLWVADNNNNRALGWNLSGVTNGAAANYVLGQGGFATNDVNRDCADTGSSGTTTPNACGLDNPIGIAVGGGRVIVADNDNTRVVFFPESVIGQSSNKAAVGVLGEASFTTETRTVTQSDLKLVCDVLYDSARSRLYVAECDTGSNRVMIWESFNPASFVDGAAASKVLGQSGFTSGAAGSGDSGMSSPYHLTVHAAGNRLFVCDSSNSRVLVFNDTTLSNGQAAIAVLGQPDFASTAPATTRSGLFGSGGVAFDAAGDRLYVSDAFNHRVLVYGSHIGDDPLVVSGGTATTSGNTVTITSTGGNVFGVTFPAGTGPIAPNTSVTITVGDGTGGTRPSIAISASLPSGQSKTVTIPWYDRDLCINDVPGATINSQGSCPGMRVRKQDVDGANECFVWEGTDTICHIGSTLVISGLEHSAGFYIQDLDDDGVDDDDDVCPNTNLNGPVPTISLRPNHMGDNEVIDGCNASQILSCKGGNTLGEQKYGVSPGQQSVFTNRLGWAKDVSPADGTPDCFQ